MRTTNEKQRPRRSREFWTRHIQKCSESELTQQEYCLRNGIGPKSMVYWKSKLKKETPGASFVQLPVPFISNRAKPAALKLVYGDKYRIEVGDGFSADTLQWPSSKVDILSIEWRELSWLIEGLDISEISGHSSLKYSTVF